MKKILSLALLASLSFQPKVFADLIAGWDFANLAATTTTTFTPDIIPATVGTASLNVSAFGLGSPQGTNPERTTFAGSALNAFPGGDAAAGNALALANSTANGKSAIFTFSMAGFEDLVVSFATRGTSTGFNTHDWSWSTDGINYTALAGNTAVTATSFEIKTIDFSAADGMDNAGTAYLKLTLSGASSGTGNNRFDNIQFNATPIAVPEPTTLSLLGGFGLLALCWRARRT